MSNRSASRSSWMMILVIAVAWQLVFPLEAHAYIDPGVASAFFQGAIAALLGAGLVSRHYWAGIKAKVKGWFSAEDEDDDD